MKKLLPFLLLLLLITFSSWSPMWAATHKISGKVLNQTTGEAVDMATVRLFSYQNSDSTLVQGLQTDQQGGFVLTAKDGAYAISTSSVRFLPKKVRCTLSGKDLTLRPIRLEEDVLALGEIQVQGHAAEMTVKGDTIEYNTAAYKVGENAMVEDVLKKMNGVTVDKEGNVTVNGESITAVAMATGSVSSWVRMASLMRATRSWRSSVFSMWVVYSEFGRLNTKKRREIPSSLRFPYWMVPKMRSPASPRPGQM